MSESEKQAIVEDGNLTVVEERQEVGTPETADPGSPTSPAFGLVGMEDSAARTSTPSGANPAPAGGPAEALGREDNNGGDRSPVDHNDNSAASLPPQAQDKVLSPAFGVRAGPEPAAGAEPNQPNRVKSGKPAGLCHHFMESGYYCQSPAVGGRRYCYSHLRLRGQQMRMARAIAKRQPYRFDLPSLDDLYAVQVAVEHVARALGAGLLERRTAGTMLYALQQSAINHRILALARMNAVNHPTLSPTAGDNHQSSRAPHQNEVGEQKRLVDEYPQFEAEFGLPKDIDLSQPPHVVFPPPEDAWPAAMADVGAAPTVTYNDPLPSCRLWTKETIELEELERHQHNMSEKSFCEQSRKIHGRIEKQVRGELRQQQEAAWQAEADRRNALEEKKAQIYRNMDDGQRQAYHLGILEGRETAKREAEEEARKKPAARAVAAS